MQLMELVALVEKMRACQKQPTQTAQEARVMRDYQSTVDAEIARVRAASAAASLFFARHEGPQPLVLRVGSTGVLCDLDGVGVRLWHGVDLDGLHYLVFVHRIATHSPEAQAKLAALLGTEVPAPGNWRGVERAVEQSLRRQQQQQGQHDEGGEG